MDIQTLPDNFAVNGYAVSVDGFDLSEPGWVKCVGGGVPKVRIEKHPTEDKYRVTVYCEH